MSRFKLTPKIELYPTTEIDKFEAGRARFLDMLGIKGALITDASLVLDFDASRQQLAQLSTAVGYCVTSMTPVWKVCRDLEDE